MRRKNTAAYRVVKVYATDLAMGDVLIDASGERIGRIVSDPEADSDGYVYADVYADTKVRGQRWPDTRLVRIRIPR